MARTERVVENLYEAASAALEEAEGSAILRKLVDELAILDKKYLALLLDRGPIPHADAAKILKIPVAQVQEIAEDLAEMIVKAFAE